MKKILSLGCLFLCWIGLFVISSCNKDNEEIKYTMSINPVDTTVYVGHEFLLHAVITPLKPDVKIEWESSDKTLLTVDNNGLAHPLKEGTVSITAKANQLHIMEKATIHIKKEVVAITNLIFPADGYKVFAGDTLHLNIAPVPNNATPLDYKYSIDNPDIAVVSSTGIITAKQVGNTILKVKVQNKTFSCPLAVKDRIKILNNSFHVLVGAQFLLAYDKNYVKLDKPNAPLDIIVSDKNILLGISEQQPLFIGFHAGKVQMTLKAPYAENSQEIVVDYPKSLFPSFTTWDASPAVVENWEKEHAGTKKGNLVEDSERDEYIINYEVKTGQEQPIPLRNYGFTKEGDAYKLSTASVYYPYIICFEDRGGGFGNFNQSFLDLLEKEGFGKPQAGGTNTFYTINKEKKLTLIITTEVINDMPMIVLNYKPKLW